MADNATVKKAVLLVGGYGTRLRPYTYTVPKPMMPFCNKPIMQHQIEALKKVGVDTLILAVNTNPASMVEHIQPLCDSLDIKLVISEEKEPMGTAGPLALAREHLTADGDDGPFIMLNADVACTYPFDLLVATHTARGKEGTIMVTPVEDPSKYGVVVFEEESGLISAFVEKPQGVPPSYLINAGIYIFNKGILDRIEMRKTSIERETFPAMVADSELTALELPGFWMDIGQPPDFLTGTHRYLASYPAGEYGDSEIVVGDNGPYIKHSSATIADSAVIGPDAVIGPNCVIGEGARIRNSTLLEGTVVKDSAYVSGSIVGWGSTVGQWARVVDSFLGEDTNVKAEVLVIDLKVGPHKGISADIREPTIIM